MATFIDARPNMLNTQAIYQKRAPFGQEQATFGAPFNGGEKNFEAPFAQGGVTFGAPFDKKDINFEAPFTQGESTFGAPFEMGQVTFGAYTPYTY